MGLLRKLSNLDRKRRIQAAGPAIRSVLGGQKLVAVDVGAAYGLLPHWAPLEKHSELFLIEPNPETSAMLTSMYAPGVAEGRVHVLPSAVSGTEGERTLYVTNASTGSSLLKPNLEFAEQYSPRSYFEPYREVRVSTQKLETLLGQTRTERVDLIKLDIQGAELEALAGLGGHRLNHLLVAELEIGMPGAYFEQTTFPDVERFMGEHGLELFDVRVNRSYRLRSSQTGSSFPTEVFGVCANSPTIAARIWEVDAVYILKPAPLLAAGDVAALRRLVAAYCAYCFFGEAYALVDAMSGKGLLPAAEADALRAAVVEWHRALHKRTLYSDSVVFGLLRRWLGLLAPRTAPRWAQYIYYDYPSG